MVFLGWIFRSQRNQVKKQSADGSLLFFVFVRILLCLCLFAPEKLKKTLPRKTEKKSGGLMDTAEAQ